MKERPKIDWEAARAAIERSEERLASAVVSAEHRERIFRQRAEMLARPVTAGNTAQQEQLLVFRLEGDRFALPLSVVTEVIANTTITVAPGAPANVAGFIQVRGEIRPVFLLKQLMGAAGTEPQDMVLLVRHRNHEVALRIGRVEDIRAVGQEDLRDGPEGNPGIKQMTADLIQILDLDFLLNENREVGEPV